MKGAWWVGKDDLDNAQKEIIILPPDRSALILGPPGSGKTNLLLLRANYLYLSGYKNLIVVVFTRSLRDFIAIGGQGYDFPESKIVTSIRWATEFLREHGIEANKITGEFDEKRHKMFSTVRGIIEKKGLKNIYDAILIDEGQDYLIDEIELFRSLTPRLFIAADQKQRIYVGDSAIDHLSGYVDSVKELEHHYRNGEKICRLADGLGQMWKDYNPMLGGCNYDEDSKPSSIEVMPCKGIEQEAEEILKKIEVQLKAYPDELIGIVTPRNKELDVIWKRIIASEFAELAVLHGAGEHGVFSPETRICVTTTHGAKGLEFRAMHLAGAEFLKKFKYQRELAFTAITRCKTSLILYHSGELPGYLQAAIQKLEPLPELADLSDIFGKGA